MALKGRYRRKTTNEGKNIQPKIKVALKTPKKNNMQGNKPYISTGLRHIFAIVSSQISTVMEPVKAIWKHEPANRWLEISPRDISFLSSLSIIHVKNNLSHL